MTSPLPLATAMEITRTGDIWLFRGRTVADRAIQTLTNSPVNHVGMAVTVEDLPPLMWHAELGRSLPDVWTGTRQRGAQLHDLHDAVVVWAQKYGQRAWLRQLNVDVSTTMEDAALRTIARLDGTPFPSTVGLTARWFRGAAPRLRGRWRRPRGEKAERAERALETAYCAEIVAMTYQAMGLLPAERPPHSFDPGSFWSGDRLPLTAGVHLGAEIEVLVDA